MSIIPASSLSCSELLSLGNNLMAVVLRDRARPRDTLSAGVARHRRRRRNRWRRRRRFVAITA